MSSIKQYQYIFSIFILFLAVQVTPKVYGQRELSFYEPMYTYDYSVKQHLALGIKKLAYDNYWFIENFKAPEGVKIIVENKPFDSYPCFRTFYIYDPNSKYLQRQISHHLDENGIVIPNSMSGAIYEYDFQNDKIEIKKKNLSDRTTVATFVFDQYTENLLELLRDGGDTLRYYYSDTIVPKKFIVNDLKISSLKNKINYEVTVYDDEKFIYEEQPFIHISKYIPPLSLVTINERLYKQTRGAKIQAKEFNSFIKKYALLDEDQKKINVKFSIQLTEEELDLLPRNPSAPDYSYAYNVEIKSRLGDNDIWITKHTITSKLKGGLTSLLFDPITKRVSKMSHYAFSILDRYNKQSTYIYQ